MNIRNKVCGFGYPFYFSSVLYKTILKFYVMIFGVILWKLPSANIYDVLFSHCFPFLYCSPSTFCSVRDSWGIPSRFTPFFHYFMWCEFFQKGVFFCWILFLSKGFTNRHLNKTFIVNGEFTWIKDAIWYGFWSFFLIICYFIFIAFIWFLNFYNCDFIKIFFFMWNYFI